MRIMKKHIGRPVDFETNQGVVNGRVEAVKNHIATIRYWLCGPSYVSEGYTTYIPVSDKRIIEVY